MKVFLENLGGVEVCLLKYQYEFVKILNDNVMQILTR